MRLSKRALAKFAGIYSGLVFGIFWIPLRALEDAGLNGVWATFMFNAVPILCLAPLVLWRRRQFFPGTRHFQICGILMGLAYVLYATAFLYTEVVRAVLLFYLMPIWGFLLARWVIGEAISPIRWFSMACGLAGMVVIFGVDSGFPLPENAGDWMALGSGMVWAVASLMMLMDERHNTVNYTAAFFFWAALLSGLAASLVTAGGLDQPPTYAMIEATLPWFLPFALIVLIPAGIATVFSPSQLNPGVVGLLFMTEVSVGVVTAALFAGEPFGSREMFGVAFITLTGIAEPLFEFIRHRSLIRRNIP